MNVPRVQADHGSIVLASQDEANVFQQLQELYKESPIPDDEQLPNLGMFLTSKNLSRILFFHHIYQKILGLHGVVMEFGVRWGQTLAVMQALRGLYEPFNRHRRIIGFDTFAGLKGVSPEDGTACQDGAFSVSPNYQQYLHQLLHLHEQTNPMAHIQRFELVSGDVTQTLPEYLTKHPETLVSLAVFDLDLYRPTKAALEAILPHLSKGSILIFDELCDSYHPGETLALREVLSLRSLRIQRWPHVARVSFVEVE